MSAPDSLRRWVVVGVVGCGLLWLSIAVGGAINQGYSHGRDYVSALSGRGSTAAFVGMTGLVGFSSAQLAAGMAFRRLSRTTAVALVTAGALGFVVAMARISCPDGAARCSLDDSGQRDVLDTVHGLGVAGYELFFLVGVVAAAIALLRLPDLDRNRMRALALFMLALASAVTVLNMPEANPGAMQRLWLAINCAAVLTITVTGARQSAQSTSGVVP